MCYPRYIAYALRRRALNADGTAKSWPHKYLFNADWNRVQGSHSNHKYSFRSYGTVLKRDCTTSTTIRKKLNNIKTFFYFS